MPRMQYLRILSIFTSFIAGTWIPLRLIGYIPPMGVEVLVDLTISAVSLVNLYLHFVHHEKNFKNLQDWLSLSVFLDILCVLPFSIVALLFEDPSFQWLMVINLLSVRHIKNIKKFMDGFPAIQPVTYRLAPLLVVMPLLVHIMSCGWIALGSGTIGPDPDPVLTYVRAVYWAFTTLTTVGYGDISAKTIGQMLYCCVTQVLGVGIFGYILSNVAGILARSDAAREHHMDNLDKVETYMNLHHIPNHLREKIRMYYHYMWMNKKGYQDDSLLADLPSKIQSELLLHINRGIVEKVPFLKGANSEMLGELMNQLKTKVFVPSEKIFKIDEKGDALYFIQSGEVEIITRDGNVIATLSDGAFFGEMALISDKPRGATAKAKTYCDVYLLEKDSFDLVANSYPSFKSHLQEVMEQRKAA